MVVTGEKRLFVVLLCPMDVAAPPRARRHSGWQTREQQKSLAIEGLSTAVVTWPDVERSNTYRSASRRALKCGSKRSAPAARGVFGSRAWCPARQGLRPLVLHLENCPSEGVCCHERRGPRNSKYMIQTIKLEPRRPRRGGVGEPLRPRRVPPPLGRRRGRLRGAPLRGTLLDNGWRFCDKELLPRRRPRARLLRRRRLVGDLGDGRPRRRRRRRGLGHGVGGGSSRRGDGRRP